MSCIAQLTEPLFGQDAEGLPVIVFALGDSPRGRYAVVVDDSGRLGFRDIETVQLDIRYDWSKRDWMQGAGVNDEES